MVVAASCLLVQLLSVIIPVGRWIRLFMFLIGSAGFSAGVLRVSPEWLVNHPHIAQGGFSLYALVTAGGALYIIGAPTRVKSVASGGLESSASSLEGLETPPHSKDV